jgi:hypothetical protein
LAGLLGINPTLVAKAYLVITFLSTNLGMLLSFSSDILLPERTFVGVEGAL